MISYKGDNWSYSAYLGYRNLFWTISFGDDL